MGITTGSGTHFGFMRGSVKVKLLIIGGVDGTMPLCRWLSGEPSTARGRLLDLEDVGGLSVIALPAEPVNTREDRVAVAGRVIARSGWENQRVMHTLHMGSPTLYKHLLKYLMHSLSLSLPPSLPPFHLCRLCT